jgi:tight adherence protein B
MNNFFSDILGARGVIVLIGAIIFIFSYRNSIKLFNWIEDQTFGTRDYILQKAELLHIEIAPNRITWFLLGIYFVPSVLVFGLFAFLGKLFLGIVLAVILMIVAWKSPRKIMDMMVKKRILLYQDQMVDGLTLLSNGLRAGLSLPQSVGMLVDELPAPISQEFNLILQQTKIGVPIDEAFGSLNKRIPTQDNEMFVSSIGILRETGGNLAEVFDTITEVIRERIRIDQKIATYVAQGKFQGGVIFMMPFVMTGIFSVTDPTIPETLFGTVPGIIACLLALTLDLIGGWMILKVVDIKV